MFFQRFRPLPETELGPRDRRKSIRAESGDELRGSRRCFPAFGVWRPVLSPGAARNRSRAKDCVERAPGGIWSGKLHRGGYDDDDSHCEDDDDDEGVNPSPKGKKGVGRGNSLDHLCPEGWWDFSYHCSCYSYGSLWSALARTVRV